MGSVTAFAEWLTWCTDNASRCEAATDKARYRVLWSCRGNVDGVGVGRGGALDGGGVGVVAGVVVAVVVGAGKAFRIAAAFCFLR